MCSIQASSSGFAQGVGDELHGAVGKPLEGAADGLHLLGGCPGAGHQITGLVQVAVEAGRGEAQSTRLQGPPGEAAHGFHVFRGRVVVAALAHDEMPDGHVRDLGPHVHGVRRVDVVEVFLEGFPAPGNTLVQRGARNVLHALHELDQLVLGAGAHRRETHAAVAHDDGGHAVPAGGGHVLVPADLAVIVRVDVHESGCQQISAGVDFRRRRACRSACGRHGRDPAVVDDHVAGIRILSGAVDDGGISDDQVVHVSPPDPAYRDRASYHGAVSG